MRNTAHICAGWRGGFLSGPEDVEECLSDTYLAAWNSIPPQRPEALKTYLGKLTRRIAIDRLRKLSSDKRGGGEIALSIDELGECVPEKYSVESEVELTELSAAISRFLRGVSRDKRRAFVFRYWYGMPVKSVAERLGFSETKTANILSRMRVELKRFLEKEDFI